MFWQYAWNDVWCSDKCRKEHYIKHCMCALPAIQIRCSLLIGSKDSVCWHFILSRLLLDQTSIQMVRQGGCRYVNFVTRDGLLNSTATITLTPYIDHMTVTRSFRWVSSGIFLMYYQNAWNDARCSATFGKACYIKHCMCALPAIQTR